MVDQKYIDSFFSKNWDDIELIISVIDSIEDGLESNKPRSKYFNIIVLDHDDEVSALFSLKENEYIPTLKKVLNDTLRLEEYRLSQRVSDILKKYDS